MPTSKVSRSGVLWFIESTLGLDPSTVSSILIEPTGIEVTHFDPKGEIVNNEFVTYRRWYGYEDVMNLPWRHDA